MEHIVSIGGWAVSDNPDDMIKTFALSTCVGLVYYNSRRPCMGMAHIQLPVSRALPAGDLPSRYADLAPGFLLQQMAQRFGVRREELLISLYGGIDAHGHNDYFRIGEKNLSGVREALRRLSLFHSDVDTGGQVSRTLFACVGSGVVEVIKRPMLVGNNYFPNKS
ncbi:MAG: chemotaxis protein CheD [Oscillospiraceae bacterium]|jgi:chemotaxis protein CheD|nr:chemotaxis protein CheD [Oscillospiraceae bacterium]